MKTIHKRNLRSTLIAIVFAFLFFASLALTHKTVSAEEIVYEKAYVGNVIDAEQYKIDYEGGKVQAEGFTVVYPSGGVYGGDKATMDQAGKYQVTYYATVNGQRVEETCYYMAVRMPKDVIVAEEGMPVSYGKYEIESPYEMKKETYGALVTFKAGQSITFSTNIKTSKLTKDYNIFELIVMPSVFRETDFEKLSIRVSDAEDATNYVDISVLSSNMVDGDGQVSYVMAGASGQMLGGYEGSTFHSGSTIYGTSVEHSFRGFGHKGEFRYNHTVSENILTLSIDQAEKKVYCGPSTNESVTKNLVNDLDDAAHYKGNPWGGFTSDEVTVKISADRFVKAEGKVVIKSFGDLDFSQDIQDTLAPQILLDCDETKALPVAEVGKEFPIFPFVARDALDAQVKTDVYVYYVDARGQKITVENNGESFLPKYAGTYQIVYRAEDYSGNVAEKTLEVTAQEVTPNIYIAIEEKIVEAEAYQTVIIPQAAEMQAFGGSGYLKVGRAVYDPNNQQLNVKDKLQLTELGDYKVVYSATDYLGNVEYGVMTVRANPVEKPTFIEEPTFDSVLVKGFTYDVIQPLVIETVGGKIVKLPCQVYVNGTLVEGSFVADGEEAVIRYVVTGETGENEWTDTISVVDTEYGKYKSKYFYTENNVQVVDEKSNVTLTFAEDASLEFINALCAKDFRLTLSYKKEMTKFTSMVFTLVDGANRNRTVTVQFFYNSDEDTWFMQLNNSATKLLYITSKDLLSFTLSQDNKKIIDTSGVEIATISAYDNGEKFEGFSETIYLQISFGGVKGESSLAIAQIGNQTMGYNKSSLEKGSDEIKPTILLDAPFVMRQKLGTKANIPTAKAFDVLGQVEEFIIKVETPAGELLATGDATKVLDLTLDKAGYYLVTYYAIDTNGNSESIPYTILVNDETAPTLTVEDDYKDEYKVGSKIDVPSYEVKDNGENCYVQVTLILPNNEVRLLQYDENGEITSLLSKDSELYESAFKADEDTFIALQKGRYVLRIVAYDEYYNYTVKEIEFLVK